jgi:hypothetical protein
MVKSRPASFTNAVEIVRMNAPCRNEPLRSDVFRTDTFFSYKFIYAILSQAGTKVNMREKRWRKSPGKCGISGKKSPFIFTNGGIYGIMKKTSTGRHV